MNRRNVNRFRRIKIKHYKLIEINPVTSTKPPVMPTKPVLLTGKSKKIY